MPDEIKVHLEGRRPLYSDKVEQVRLTRELALQPGGSTFVRVKRFDRKRLWVRRDERWMTTVEMNANGQPAQVKITNVADRVAVIPTQTVVAI